MAEDLGGSSGLTSRDSDETVVKSKPPAQIIRRVVVPGVSPEGAGVAGLRGGIDFEGLSEVFSYRYSLRLVIQQS